VARTEHFIGLEWLRFLLAIYVVLFHTVHAYVEDEPTWLSELAGVGFFATSSFFVLSGFLLAHVYCRQGELREPARHFLGKRLANLYPLHLFSLLLTAIVLTIIAKLGIPPDDAKASLRYVVYDTNEELSGEARDALEYFMNNRELTFNFILQLLMLHAWNPLYLTFNPPLWSISTLFFFYLCFPLLAPRLMRLRHKGWWLLAIAALYLLPPLWAIQQDAYGIPVTGMLHRMPLLRLPEFSRRHSALRAVPRMASGRRATRHRSTAGTGGLRAGELSGHGVAAQGRTLLVFPVAQRPAAAGATGTGLALRADRHATQCRSGRLVTAPRRGLVAAVRAACAGVHPLLALGEAARGGIGRMLRGLGRLRGSGGGTGADAGLLSAVSGIVHRGVRAGAGTSGGAGEAVPAEAGIEGLMPGRVKSHAHARQKRRRKDHNRKSTGNTDSTPSERAASETARPPRRCVGTISC